QLALRVESLCLRQLVCQAGTELLEVPAADKPGHILKLPVRILDNDVERRVSGISRRIVGRALDGGPQLREHTPGRRAADQGWNRVDIVADRYGVHDCNPRR